MQPSLTHTHYCKVRFSEVDSMNIVWHGNYVLYLEEAREAFGEKYGIGYKELKEVNLQAPVVDLSLKYLKYTEHGDYLKIVIQLHDQIGSKLCFSYSIYNANEELCLKAKSVQVFTNSKGELELITPEYIRLWKLKTLI